MIENRRLLDVEIEDPGKIRHYNGDRDFDAVSRGTKSDTMALSFLGGLLAEALL